MERKTNPLTFLDHVVGDLGGKRTAEFFDKCDEYIPWQALALRSPSVPTAALTGDESTLKQS